MDQAVYAARDSRTGIFIFTLILLIDSLFYLEACIIRNVFEFLWGIEAGGLKLYISIEALDGLRWTWPMEWVWLAFTFSNMILMPT